MQVHCPCTASMLPPGMRQSGRLTFVCMQLHFSVLFMHPHARYLDAPKAHTVTGRPSQTANFDLILVHPTDSTLNVIKREKPLSQLQSSGSRPMHACIPLHACICRCVNVLICHMCVRLRRAVATGVMCVPEAVQPQASRAPLHRPACCASCLQLRLTLSRLWSGTGATRTCWS